jgi:flagellar basal-body rod modification protein FlgD
MSPTTSVTGTSQSSNSQADQLDNSLDTLSNEQAFLQLLVAQIQNQDPLNPTDSTQFLSQLTSFSQLEQLIGIRTDMDANSAGATAQNSSQGSTGNSSGTNATGQTAAGN